jgi:uncharacterized protein (TIGR00369 family)
MATVFACFSRFRRRPICQRLPPVATARLHKCSILRCPRWLRCRTRGARRGHHREPGELGGRVAIALPIEPRLSQQDGFLHAGVVVAALDNACGYAALTLMPDDAEVLTVELKVNLLAPAGGHSLVAEGEVVQVRGSDFVALATRGTSKHVFIERVLAHDVDVLALEEVSTYGVEHVERSSRFSVLPSPSTPRSPEATSTQG